MTCVPRRRENPAIFLFTFSAVVLLAGCLAGCVAPTTRVLMRDFRPRTPLPPALTPGAPSAATQQVRESVSAAAGEAAAVELIAAGAFVLESVPVARLTSAWSVRFGVDCVTPARDSLSAEDARVFLLGDFDEQGYALRIKLDASISRSLPGRQKERAFQNLAHLHDPWVNIGAGRHRLAVFAARVTDGQVPIDDSGKPAVAFCDFHADSTRVVATSEGPSEMALLGPEGTLHGEAARPLVQAFWVGAVRRAVAKPSARLVIDRAAVGRESEALGSGAYRLLPAPGAPPLSAGDYALWTQVDAGSVDARTGAMAAMAAPVDERRVHIITINPE